MADVTNISDVTTVTETLNVTDTANVTEKKFDEITPAEQDEKKIELANELRNRFAYERSIGLEIGAKSLATVIGNKIPYDLRAIKAGDCRRMLKDIKAMCEEIKPKSETLEELENNKQELIKLLDPEVAKKVYGITDEAEKEAVNE